MKLYLHIGSHKTATTAIQHFARRNRDWLLERGLLYPSLELLGGRTQQSHLGLMAGLFGMRSTKKIDKTTALEVLRRGAELASAREANVLFSAENLFRLAPRVRTRAYKLFASYFGDFELVTVVGLRRQDILADSLYKNNTRSPKRQPPFAEFLESRRGVFSYLDIVEQAEANQSARPILLPFTKTTKNTYLLDFFNTLGVDISDAPKPSGLQNVSYDMVDCLVKRSLFDLRVDPEVMDAFDVFVQKEPVRTNYSFFTPDSRTKFMAEYQPQNDTLCANYPEMTEALGRDAIVDVAEPYDQQCQQLVASRLLQFREFVAAM